MPIQERFSVQPLAMVSAMVSPSPEQRLVLLTETKYIVPLATLSNASMIVQEYGHLMLPFLKSQMFQHYHSG